MSIPEIDLNRYKELNHKQLETLKVFYNKIFGDDVDPEDKLAAQQLTINNDLETCYRFLVARKFKIDKANKMLHSALQWRKKEDIDTLLNRQFNPEDMKYIRQMVPHNLHRTDKLGNPFIILDAGRCETLKIRERFNDRSLALFHVQILEYVMKCLMPKLSREHDTIINQVTLIVDLHGVSAGSMKSSGAFKLLKYLSKIDQDFYPEILNKLFFIHTPKAWAIMWNIMKIFFDKRTREKINILKPEQVPELLHLISEVDLPVIYGGKCNCHPTDPNGGCYTGPNFVDFPELLEFDQYILQRSEGHVMSSISDKPLTFSESNNSADVPDKKSHEIDASD